MLWAILALSSAFFAAIKDILAKKLFKKNVNPSQLIFEEYLVLLVFILVFFGFKVDYSSFYEIWHLYFLKAISVGGASLLYFKLLKKYDISVVSPLLNLSPMILLVLSVFVLGEIISSIQVVGILIILLATYFLEVTFHHHQKTKPHAHHFSILKKLNFSFFSIASITLVIISFAAIADKKILGIVDVYTNLYFTALLIFIGLLIYYLVEKSLIQTIKDLVHEPETLLISIFSIISSFLVVYAIAIPSAMVSLIIPLRRTATLFSSLIGGILFHEKHLKQKFIATFFMLIGVLFIVI